MPLYRELEKIVDGRWGVEHPEQATAICMERVHRHLGLDNLRGDSVLQQKPEPSVKRKRKPKPKLPRKPKHKPKKVKPVHVPPLGADGVPMVKATELGPRLGYGPYSLKNWVVRGHIPGIVQMEGGHPKLYVSEAAARGYLATRTETRGRKRKERQ